jgi:hypothetical protein
MLVGFGVIAVLAAQVTRPVVFAFRRVEAKRKTSR